MPPRKKRKVVNVNQKEKLMTLFHEASDDSEDQDERSSQEESEESERSADERRGLRDSEEGTDNSKCDSDTSSRDPYSDADGEYGSDENYEPDENETSTDDDVSGGSSDSAESESENVPISRKPVRISATSSRKRVSSSPPLVQNVTPSAIASVIQPHLPLVSHTEKRHDEQAQSSQKTLLMSSVNTKPDRSSSSDKKPSREIAKQTKSPQKLPSDVHTKKGSDMTAQSSKQSLLDLSLNKIPDIPTVCDRQIDISLKSSREITEQTKSLQKLASDGHTEVLHDKAQSSQQNVLDSTPNNKSDVSPSSDKQIDLSLETSRKIAEQTKSPQKLASDGHIEVANDKAQSSQQNILNSTTNNKSGVSLSCDKQVDLSLETSHEVIDSISPHKIKSTGKESSSLPTEPSHSQAVVVEDCVEQISPSSPEKLSNVAEMEHLAPCSDEPIIGAQVPSDQDDETRSVASLCVGEQREQSESSFSEQLPAQQIIAQGANHDDDLRESLLQNVSQQGNTTRRVSSPTVDEIWEETTASIKDFEFDTANVGPSVPLDDSVTPLDVLNLLFTDELLDHIVTCVNAYGSALCNQARPHTRGSRKRSFKPTDAAEMKKFLGLCLLGGQIDAPSIRKLFTCTDPLYYHPIYPYTMSGRRFEQLLRCLCVSELNSKGMNKVKLFVEKVIRNFQNVYSPHKELSLDESLLKFRGRLSFRQYIKAKKAKYGIKFYILSTDDGYVLNFVIYEGKSTPSEGDDNTPKLEKLVMKLMQPYLHKGHELYMDNFYNSVGLSKKLLQYKTHTTGTLRKDRKGNPKEICKKRLKKGDYVWARKGNVYVSIWRDKRDVSMITTKHHPRLVVSRNRYGKRKTKPVEIVDYNNHMSGIDKMDQMTSYYSTPKKSIRWYKKVFFHVFDMIMTNAFYIFKKYCDSRATLLSFREYIINSYLQTTEQTFAAISNMSIKKNASRRQKQMLSTRDAASTSALDKPAVGHWPEMIPLAANTKRNKLFLKCRVCTKNKKTKQTSYRCKGCLEKPPLCPGCFEAWHAQ